MTSHLRVTIDDIDLVLTEDTSISVEMKNPYLNEGIDTYSYQFDVPIEGNRELFGDVDNPDSDIRLSHIEGHPMAIYVDGILFAHGKVDVIDEQTIVDKVSISMTSNKKQLKDLIGDLKLRDLQFPEEDKQDLKIGEKIGNITVSGLSDYQVRIKFRVNNYDREVHDYFTALNAYSPDAVTRKLDTKKIQPQALGFSCNKEYYIDNSDMSQKVVVAKDAEGKRRVKQDYINTTVPFGSSIMHNDGVYRRALYHNARISYLQHGIDSDGKSSSDTLIKGQYGPYYVLPADRPQSGICFFVLYVLEVLFKQLEVIYGRDQYAAIAKVPDMNRLSFFTTLCKFDVEPKYYFHSNIDSSEDDFGKFENFDANRVNEWLEERDCRGEIKANKTASADEYGFVTVLGNTFVFYPNIYAFTSKDYPSVDRTKYTQVGAFLGSGKDDNRYFFGLKSEAYTRRISSYNDTITVNLHKIDGSVVENIVMGVGGEGVDGDASEPFKYGASVMNMYANSQNLPDMSASSFIDSLWASFGLRFYYNSESNVVEPYYIRDVLKSSVVHDIFGKDVTVHPVAERITGVTIKYSSEKDRKEQLADIYNGVSNYDTSFDYLVDKTDVRKINVAQIFDSLAHGIISAGDETLYIDTETGNAFRIKINKEELDASNINALQPALFRVAQWKGVTVYKDEYDKLTDVEKQTSEISDYIEEISSEFVPLDQNDLNARKNLHTALLCPFTDEEMWSNEAEMPAIQSVVDSTVAFTHTVECYVKTDERYDPTGTDSGNSPLQDIDWGAAITLMRGGGSDAYITHFDYGYDLFNNEKWRMVAGTVTMDSDSISLYNEMYDYNGSGVVISRPYDGTYTKSEAEKLILSLWSGSNANLVSPYRVVSADSMVAHGWSRSDVGTGICTVLSGTKALTDYNGIISEFLFTPIGDNGSIMSPDEINTYLANLELRASQLRRSIMSLDAETDSSIISNYKVGKHALIQQFDVSPSDGYHSKWADFYSELLHQLHDIYYGDATEVNCPAPEGSADNGNGDGERVSLCIRAYHNAPDDIPGTNIKKGDRLCKDDAVARRGLADKFFSEYIYFLLHRKKLSIKTLCEIQYIIDMQWKDRYCIAGHTGWINLVSTRISNAKGIENVEFTMFEL